MTHEQRAKAALDAAFKETDNVFDERIILKHIASALAEADHCKDCCCARSWAALGITGYTGMSIVEHIEALKAEAAALRLALAEKDKELDEARQSFMKAVNDYQGSEFAAITALREQIGRLQVEREEMKRTYDKTVERLAKQFVDMKSYADHMEIKAQAARIEGLRSAREIVIKSRTPTLDIDAEIAALGKK